MGPAQRSKGAGLAEGGAVWQAHHGPQLHEGLVEVPHPGGEDGGDLPLGPALDLGVQDIVVAVQQPGGDPEHVAVHRGDGQPEGDGGDGPGGVVPDAGEGPQGVEIGGDDAAVALHHRFCPLLQVAHPVVVAQALPQL